MTSIKEETISGVKWRTIEKFSVEGIHFFLGLIMARLLTAADYGTVGMLAVFLSISSTFIDSGFTNALIQKKNRDQVDFSTVFYFNIVVAILIYIILFFSAPWVSVFFKMPILTDILRMQAIGLIIRSISSVQVTQLVIKIDFKALARRSMYSSLIAGVAGVLMAYHGFGVWALVYQDLILATINVIFICWYCRWLPLPVFSISSFKRMFSFGGKLLVSNLINQVYKNLNQIVIGKAFSAGALGYYKRGTQFARFPNQIINGSIKSVTFPILSKIQDDDEHLVAVYRKYIRISSMCIFFGCVLVSALAKPLIIFLLTEKWSPSIIFLHIYCFACMFDHLNGINLNLLQVKGRSDLFLRLEIIKKIIATIILFSAVPFGIIGVCLSKILWSQTSVFINTYYTGKLFGLGYISQVRDYSGYFFRSVVACVPAFLLTFVDIPHIVQLLLGALISVAIYYCLLRKDESMKEVLEILNNYFLGRLKKVVRFSH